jgi:hypothetical protein
MRTIIDHDRVEVVLDEIMDRYYSNGYPYNSPAAILPQDPRNMPKRLVLGSREHAMFFFVLCLYMRGGMQSTTAAKQLARLYNRRPLLFQPERVAEQREESIRRSCESVRLLYMKNIAPGYWIENAKRLCEWHDGDPRKIYVAADYDEVCERLCNRSHKRKGTNEFTRRIGFQGFQHKMASMLTYYLVDAGLIPKFDFAVPIDFHVMRISVATEMLRFEKLPEDRDVYGTGTAIRTTLRGLYLDYTVRRGVDPIDLTNAVWLLSKALCARHPGNQSTTIGGYQARGTMIVPFNPTWTERETRTFGDTCARCPAKHHCVHDVPNAPYTRKGKLLLLRPRSVPPAFILNG